MCLYICCFAILCALLPRFDSLDIPCRELQVGEECLFDEECYGPNTICRGGRCECQYGFDEHSPKEGVKICRPGGDSVGDRCSSEPFGCRPPLLCYRGNCSCFEGQWNSRTKQCSIRCQSGTQLVGSECHRVAQYRYPCDENTMCVDPFTACTTNRQRRRTCQCVSGTRRSGNQCVPSCPDGSRPRQSCRRLHTNDADMLAHSTNELDSCPSGFQCLTYGKPTVGHCCPFKCPYGQPDTSRSCDAGAPFNQRCLRVTHFCHYVDAPGWKTALCCPKPCREPTPMYLNGECLPVAHFGDICESSEQCEGGKNMVCQNAELANGRTRIKRCVCKNNFRQALDRYPTCVPNCFGATVAVNHECLNRVSLDGSCMSSDQCPLGAYCYYGKCKCKCGFQAGLGSCFNPDDPLGLSLIGGFLGRGN